MTDTIQHFYDLHAWQSAHQLALSVYEATHYFPKAEQCGLTNQMRRAAVSVPSNIAEGFNRFSAKEKVQFYSTAIGSIGELQSQALLSKDLGYIDAQEHETMMERLLSTKKLTSALAKSVHR
jgi:four helix bundle protein